MEALGRHILVEYYGCNSKILNDEVLLRTVLMETIREARGTIVADVFHRFSPYGVTGVVVIAESHVAIHTWPEHGYAAVDIFTCSENLATLRIICDLEEKLMATRQSHAEMVRGGSLEVGRIPLDTRCPSAHS
jgi:S-adenosylmethionine decarboxylase